MAAALHDGQATLGSPIATGEIRQFPQAIGLAQRFSLGRAQGRHPQTRYRERIALAAKLQNPLAPANAQ